jgi:aminoglycoside phosphotransferase (APT) family kinase protein
VTGAPFYFMDHIDGIVISSVEVGERLTPEARATAGLSLASTLARLQSTDLDASGLADMRRPGSYCSRQLRRWRKQWESSRTRELPLVDQLADRLEANMPEETDSTLVHGDYHLFNAILGEDGAVRVIVDWELCTVGDPLGDVGLMIAYWNELGAPARQDSRLFREPITELPGFPSTAEMIAEYARASGRDVSDVAFWVSFAYWKIAIITEGVYRRWLSDPANGTNPGHLGASIERLVDLADRTAAEASI